MAAKDGKGRLRLDKFLADMGVGTRSQVKEMARKGRICLNGVPVKDLSVKLDPEKDAVEADHVLVAYASMEYYMLNKPAGVVSATEDGQYPVVTDLIETALRKDLFPVGRLDLDTEGLLLLTNDGKLAHELLSPRRHVDKVYYVEYDGLLPADAPSRFEAGLTLEDGTKTMAAVWEEDREGRGRLTIREGKFHQVKRMFEALGCRVSYLKRLSMGTLVLDPALEPGQYRPLTESELESLGRSKRREEQIEGERTGNHEIIRDKGGHF